MVVTEKWNNSSWSTTSNLNGTRYSVPLTGTTSAALCAGGYSGTVLTSTEKRSGTAWATTSVLNVARNGYGMGGSTASAIAAGSYGVTELWNGSSWSITSSMLLDGWGSGAFAGDSTKALYAGGWYSTDYAGTETWS
jgi:hypothetical protein